MELEGILASENTSLRCFVWLIVRDGCLQKKLKEKGSATLFKVLSMWTGF